MKRLLVSMLLVLVLAGVAVAFERETPALPIISKPLSVLKDVTGWMITPSGTWVNRKNRIPKYLPNEYQTLQDYTDYSLGTDNFTKIELREIEYDNQVRYILLKHYKDGRFKYPTIREDWYNTDRIKGYVFEKKAMYSLSLEDREATLVEIPLVYAFDLSYNAKRYLDDIAAKVAEGRSGYEDIIAFNVLKIGDSVRFIMLEGIAYKEVRSYKNMGYGLPVDAKGVLTEEVFRNFYYELDFDVFDKFWNDHL